MAKKTAGVKKGAVQKQTKKVRPVRKSITTPKQISDVLDAEYNPRRIGPIADAALKESLFIFGPLDGFVLNLETNSVICGHQRRRHIADMKPDDIEWGASHKVKLGPKQKRFISTEINGTFQDEHGNHWGVRAVQWPLWFEQAANISANNPNIAGEFTEELQELLADLESSFPVYDELRLDALEVLLEKNPDWEKEWNGMPEFDQQDETSWKILSVHFKNETDYLAFAKLIDQRLTQKTRAIWYPEIERRVHIDKSFAVEDDASK